MTVDIHEALICSAKQGDHKAFTKLVVLNQQLIRGYIAARIRYPQDVDDLAQDTFILAFNKLSELEHNKAFRSWLYGIALNLVRNHYRKFNPTAEGEDNILDTMVSETLEQGEGVFLEGFSITALKACLNELSSDLKQLMNRHYKDNYSVKALTETYKVKHSTITMRLHRTRAILRKCILNKLSREENE